MTQGLLFSSGTSSADSGIFGGRSTEGQRGSIGATLTCHIVRRLLASPTARRGFYRAQIVGLLLKYREPERCIDELLQVCTAEGGADGLDLAIDVLAKTSELVLRYAWDYIRHDIQSWTPASDRAYQPNDDYWYVLLRAVARTDADPRKRLRFILCCAFAASRGIREGVMEALRDLGTPDARQWLQRFAEADPDDFIRQIAREALVDLES